VSWTRHGECNHCGWCCESLSRQYVVRAPQEPYWVEFYKARGFAAAEDGTVGRFGWLMAPCPAHVDERCAMGDERPQRCKDFPIMPTEIVGTPCSYWFESGELRAGGMGSLYPTTDADLLRIERDA